MSDDIPGSSDAVLQVIPPNSLTERQRARRACATEALGSSDSRTHLRSLLGQLGLNPAKGEDR